MLSSKNKKIYYKKAKEHACLYLWDYTSNHDENKDGNRE